MPRRLSPTTRKRHERTNRFSGVCQDCVYPIVRELDGVFGDFTRAACPECGKTIKLARLFGEYSDQNCDDRCQFAAGPSCDCACGGANHMRGYIPLEQTGVISASALEKFRRMTANRRAGAQRRAETRRQAQEAERQAQFERMVAAIPEDVRDLLASEEIDPATIEGANDYTINTIRDIRRRFIVGRWPLSPRQIELVQRLVAEAAERAETQRRRDAEVKVEAPEGRMTVEGTVISRKEKYDEYSGGTYHRLTLKCYENEGVYFINLREPAAVRCDLGDVLSVKATIERSDTDTSFAFGKRPTNPVIVGHEENWTEDQVSALD